MIYAHFHIWQLARGDYGWLRPVMAVLYRDVALDDWRCVARSSGITACILVKAAPTDAGIEFLLQQAEDADDVLGVVVWVDLLAADAPARIAALAQRPELCGLRPMLQDIADPDWILQDALSPALQAMQSQGLTFDAQVRALHLPRISDVMRRHPCLRVVIDHRAKPDVVQSQRGG